MKTVLPILSWLCTVNGECVADCTCNDGLLEPNCDIAVCPASCIEVVTHLTIVLVIVAGMVITALYLYVPRSV